MAASSCRTTASDSSPNCDQISRREACCKLFLSVVSQSLQLQVKSHKDVSGNDEYKSFKRQRERQRYRRRLYLPNKMRKMYIPSILSDGGTLRIGDEHPESDRRVWMRDRSSMWWDVVVKEHWKDSDWIENFRMSKSTFMYICEKVRNKLTYTNTNMRKALPVEQRLAITIWRLATNCGYRVIGELFGVGRSTVCIIVQQTCKVFASTMQEELLTMPSGEDLTAVIEGFQTKYNLPQVGGCCGTCHIPIKLPDANNALQYINSRGNPTLILQTVVDDKGQFRAMSGVWQGSASDSQIFRQSNLYQPASEGALFDTASSDVGGEGVPVVLLAGESLPLLKGVMKPYDKAKGVGLTDQQRLYNQKVNEALSVLDEALLRLKGRWQILIKRNEHKLAFIPDIATTCCILHNICEQHEEPFSPDTLEGQEVNHVPCIPCSKRDDTSSDSIRQALTADLVKNSQGSDLSE